MTSNESGKMNEFGELYNACSLVRDTHEKAKPILERLRQEHPDDQAGSDQLDADFKEIVWRMRTGVGRVQAILSAKFDFRPNPNQDIISFESGISLLVYHPADRKLTHVDKVERTRLFGRKSWTPDKSTTREATDYEWLKFGESVSNSLLDSALSDSKKRQYLAFEAEQMEQTPKEDQH